MDLLTILCHVAVAQGVFKIFHIPVSKWTISTAILGRVVVIGVLILAVNYNHPYTPRVRKIAVSTPMVPQVLGEMVKVTSRTNVLAEKGELLFHTDDTRYRVQLNKLEADLTAGEAMLRTKQATINDVSARVQWTQAEYDRVTRDYQRYAQGAVMPVNLFSEQDVTHVRQQVQIQTTVLQTAKAQLQNAREQVPGRYSGLDVNIASLKSQILETKYNLAQTVVRAPSDGYVTQLLTRSGMTAIRLPFKPVLVFIFQQRRRVVAVLHQNLVLCLTIRDSTEAMLNGPSGSVYSSKVPWVLPVIPDGSYQASDALQGLSVGTGKEGIYVLIDLDPHLEVEHLPDGASAQVAVYIDYFAYVPIMRKILLRVTS